MTLYGRHKREHIYQDDGKEEPIEETQKTIPKEASEGDDTNGQDDISRINDATQRTNSVVRDTKRNEGSEKESVLPFIITAARKVFPLMDLTEKALKLLLEFYKPPPKH